MREVSDERRGRWIRMAPVFQMNSFGKILDVAPLAEPRDSAAWKAWEARSQSKGDRDSAQMRDDVVAEIADQMRDMLRLDSVSQCFHGQQHLSMHLIAGLLAYKYGLATRDEVFERMGLDDHPTTSPDMPERVRQEIEAYWRENVASLNAALDELDAWDEFWPDPKGVR